MATNTLLMRMSCFFSVFYSAFIYIITKIIFIYVKRKKIKERIKPAKYSQIFSPLSLEVGIKPRDRTDAAYHIIRPLL